MSCGIKNESYNSWKGGRERAPGLLADIALEGLQVVVVAGGVARIVGAQRAHEDHGHQARQEDDHHEAVEDGEPVDLRASTPLRQTPHPPGHAPCLLSYGSAGLASARLQADSTAKRQGQYLMQMDRCDLVGQHRPFSATDIVLRLCIVPL